MIIKIQSVNSQTFSWLGQFTMNKIFNMIGLNCCLIVHLCVRSNNRIPNMGIRKWSYGKWDTIIRYYDTISGCNSESTVNGKSKPRWLNAAQKEEYLQSGRCQLGDAIRISADVFQKFEKVFCDHYGMPDETNINTPELHQLQLIKDEFLIIRVNYLAYVWRRCSRYQPWHFVRYWSWFGGKNDHLSVVLMGN